MVNNSNSFAFYYKNLLFVPNWIRLEVYCDLAFTTAIGTAPILLSTLCYYKIYKVVFNSKKAVNKNNPNATKDKSIYRTLIIMLVALLFTFLPISMAFMAQSLLGLDLDIYLYRFASYLCMGGSFVNPLIFAFFNRQFREAYIPSEKSSQILALNDQESFFFSQN